MRQGTPFSRCPRCGNTTRLPVITCPKCFYDATPPPVSTPVLGYMFVILIAVVLIGALSWQRLNAKPHPFIGEWKGTQATFTFMDDGTFSADAYFDSNGRFHPVPKVLKQRWTVLVGDILTIERKSTDGKNTKMASKVQWELGDSGKSLTLRGIGRTDNYTSKVVLRKSASN